MSFSCTSFDITKATPWLCLWVSRVSCCPPVACRHQQPHTANHSQIRTLPLPTDGNNPCANTHIIVYPAGRSSTLTTCCCAVCYIKLPLPLPLAPRPSPHSQSANTNAFLVMLGTATMYASVSVRNVCVLVFVQHEMGLSACCCALKSNYTKSDE